MQENNLPSEINDNLNKIIVNKKEQGPEEKNIEIISYIKNRCIKFFNKNTKTNNFTISGGWGTGKTEILKQFENNIEKEFGKGTITFIKINLWDYELLPDNQVFTKIITQIIKDLQTIYEPKWQKITKELGTITLKFIQTIGVVLNWTSATQLLENLDLKSEININTKNLIKIWKKDKTEKMVWEDLIKSFEKILKKLDAKTILIFDDLDRVAENKIINILTAIKNFFFRISSNNLFFLTALNENYINNVLKCQDEKELYTEKIFEKKNKIEITYEVEYNPEILLTKIKESIFNSNFPNKEALYEENIKKIYSIIINSFKQINPKLTFRDLFNKLDFIYSVDFWNEWNNKSFFSTDDFSKLIDIIFLKYLKRENLFHWRFKKSEIINNAFISMFRVVEIWGRIEDYGFNKKNYSDWLLSRYDENEKIEFLEKINKNNLDFLENNFFSYPCYLLTDEQYGIYHKRKNQIEEKPIKYNLNIINFIPFIDIKKIDEIKNKFLQNISPSLHFLKINHIIGALDSDFAPYILSKQIFSTHYYSNKNEWYKHFNLFNLILEDNSYE